MNLEFETAWDESYARKENTLFYPSEPVVRFVNKFIRRRVGPSTFSKEFEQPPVVVDIGSGAGRHMLFLIENGFFPIGVELSGVACQQAVALLTSKNIGPSSYEIVQSGADNLDLATDSIDFAVSAATFDSMPTATAIAAASEVLRILKPGGLFCVDVIGDEVERDGETVEPQELLVSEVHEFGTIQSHFSATKIDGVFGGFELLESLKIVTSDGAGTVLNARWHLVIRKPEPRNQAS